MCWKIGIAGIFTEKHSLWFLAALGDPCGHLAFPFCTFDFRRICWEKNILSALTSNFFIFRKICLSSYERNILPLT